MIVIDYYAELDISPSLGLDEIKQALVRLCKVYEKREADGFEAAREKLVIISKAEAVFKTTHTRQHYDRELAESKNESTENIDPMKERKAQYRQWFSKAADYNQNGQHDSAKKAIDRAFRYVGQNDDDAELYSLAAEIYRLNGDLKGALDHVNEAMILDEENIPNYINKFLIYEGLENSNYSDRGNYDVHKRREILGVAKRLAKKGGNLNIIAQIYDLLALAWLNGQGADRKLAEEFAHKAKELNPKSPNASIVLEMIENLKREQKEQARQMKETENLARQKRESEEAAAELKRKEDEINREAHRIESVKRMETEKRNHTFKKFYILSWVLFIVSFFVVQYGFFFARQSGGWYGNLPFAFITLGILFFVATLWDKGMISKTIIGAAVFIVFDIIVRSDVAPSSLFFSITFYIIALVGGSALGGYARKNTD